jgi:hypothetical protein
VSYLDAACLNVKLFYFAKGGLADRHVNDAINFIKREGDRKLTPDDEVVSILRDVSSSGDK